MKKLILIATILAVCAPAFAADVVKLPAPKMEGGKPLMECLKLRQSGRAYDTDKPLDDQMLANLLWAAFGVNRDNGKRTAPSAVNWQEVDLYVAKADGLWLYHAAENALEKIKDEDIRPSIGRQKFTAAAPVILIYVADYAKMRRASETDMPFYSAADTGFISQNVYLFAASEGLATVVIGLIDKPVLGKTIGLRAEQHVVLAQPIGYPK